MRYKHRAKSSHKKHVTAPWYTLLTLHLLALGIALLIYALPHHVIVREQAATGITTTRVASGYMQPSATPYITPTPTPDPTQTPIQPVPTADRSSEYAVQATTAPSAVPTSTPAPQPTLPPIDTVGSFRYKFAEHFTDGEIIQTADSYRSADLDITVSSQYLEQQKVRFFVVDAYVADISCFGTALAHDTFGRGYSEWPIDVIERTGSIATMNGDFYGMRKGIVMRNGTLYSRTHSARDICIVYWDGTMKTFNPKKFNLEQEIENGAYHMWNFGPGLLDTDGSALKYFNSNFPYLTPPNPRSAVGYFEPGHYCFVVVDGRSKDTVGVTLAQLAKIMSALGCKQAYNLDGGATSMLYFKSELVNNPYKGGRECSDFLTFTDLPS